MNFFNNSLSANKYLRIIKLSPKKLSKEFILRNFGLLIGDKSFYKILICFQLLEETKNIKGDIIEFGIWNGNNLFTIKKIIDFLKIKKKLYGYDNFSGFPNPKSVNKKNKKFGIYAGNRKFLRFVINFFKLKNIEIIDDDIMNLKRYKSSLKKLSFIYVDCDIYKTTKKILDDLKEKLSIGGVIVFDEGIYGKKTEEPKALREFHKKYKKNYKKVLLKKKYQPDVYLKKVR